MPVNLLRAAIIVGLLFFVVLAVYSFTISTVAGVLAAVGVLAVVLGFAIDRMLKEEPSRTGH